MVPFLLLVALDPWSVDLFKSGENGYHTYRIPAIVETKRGSLLAFCEGRRGGRGDAGDIDLLVKKSRDGGKTWSSASVIFDGGGDTIGNPAPVVEKRSGTVFLLFTRNRGDDTERQIIDQTAKGTRTVWVTQSRDDGKSWSKPQEITGAVKARDWTWYATGPGNGIQTKKGRLLVACDHITAGAKEYFSHVIYSDDRGKTWKLGGSAGPGANESTIAELPDGKLILNMRSYRGRHRRLVARSSDGGLTWTGLDDDEALIEPVCQASLIASGSLLLFSNPASEKRERMTVRLSRDGGATWPEWRTVYAGPAAYSNLVNRKRGGWGLLYENGVRDAYEKITFFGFDLDWLMSR